MYLAQYFSVVFFCNVLRICYTTLKSQYKDLLLNKNKSSIYKKNKKKLHHAYANMNGEYKFYNDTM